MSAFFHLWLREMGSYFRTSIAYVVGVFFLLITGFSFWMLSTRLAQGTADGDMASTFFGSLWFWLGMLIVALFLLKR